MANNNKNINIDKFIASINDMLASKYILIDRKISDILLAIAETHEVYNLIAECMVNFDFKTEWKLATSTNVMKLPSTNEKRISFIFCLLNNIDDKNLDAIIELRNEVAHNRFLLHRKFKPCKNTGYEEHSLRANIINLYNHLPEEIRNSFARELKASSEFSENKWQYQTEWSLIEQIIIKID